MPLSSPTAAPPTALQLNRQAAEDMPDYAHPLTEELVRRIAAGEITGEQAFNEAQAHVQQFSGAPGALPPTALGAAPQQATLGGAPQAPAPQAPQQAAPQAPMQAPQQPAQQPRRAPGIAPEVPGAPGAAPSLAPQQPQPAAPPANNQQQDPLANANNMNAAPSFSANVAKGRNQIGDALTNTLPEGQRTQVPQGGANAQAQGAQAQAPSAPATGYQAARNAIFGLGPRMTNKDVAVFMQAFVQGGKPAIEMEKERGRAFRASQTDGTRNRGLDIREQGLQDKWDTERNRLSFDKEREANKLAMHLEDLEMGYEKLRANIRRAKESGYDRFELQRMKDAAALSRTTLGTVAQLGASLQNETPTARALISEMENRYKLALEEAERISNYAITTKSDPNAPASSMGTQALSPGPQAPNMTAGEAAKKNAGKKPGKMPTGSTPPAQKTGDPDPEIQVRRKSDGAVGMVRTSKFNSNTYEMVSK